MRRMRGLKSPCKVLRREEMEMAGHWKNLSLVMEVILGRRTVAACDQTERLILNELETAERCWGIIWIYDGSRVVEERPNKTFERHSETLLVMAKRRVCHSP